MSTVIGHLDWLGGWSDLRIEHGCYYDGTRSVMLVTRTGELLTKASTCLAEYGLAPRGDCFWIKTYSEGEGLADALVAAGVVSRTGRMVRFGVHGAGAEECAFTPDYKEDWPRAAVVEV